MSNVFTFKLIIDVTLIVLVVFNPWLHADRRITTCMFKNASMYVVCRLARDLRLSSPEIDSTRPIRRKCSQQEPASGTIYGLGKVIRSRSCEQVRSASRFAKRNVVYDVSKTYRCDYGNLSRIQCPAFGITKATSARPYRSINTISTPNCIRRHSFGIGWKHP